jgi:hypothetical protein
MAHERRDDFVAALVCSGARRSWAARLTLVLNGW